MVVHAQHLEHQGRQIYVSSRPALTTEQVRGLQGCYRRKKNCLKKAQNQHPQGFPVQEWLSWNSLCSPGWPRTQKSPCLYQPSAGIKGVYHHCPVQNYLSSFHFIYIISTIIFNFNIFSTYFNDFTRNILHENLHVFQKMFIIPLLINLGILLCLPLLYLYKNFHDNLQSNMFFYIFPQFYQKYFPCISSILS